MKYLSVCSGVEAATVAWHPLGWVPVAFAEIEKFPSQVLAHHYPATPNMGDMTKFKEWNIDRPNLIVGGTPCQSFSVAGLRKGLRDPRGNLALTFLAMVDHYRPEWVVWENVPGVLSSGGGRDFGSFLGGLAELGYGFSYRVLDAQFFGVAQRRRRVFVVANARDWRRAAAVLFEPDSLSGNPAPRRQAREAIAPTIRAGAANGGAGHGARSGDSKDELILPVWPKDVAPALDCTMKKYMGYDNQHVNGGCGWFVPAKAHTLRAEGFDAGEDGTGRGTPLIPVPIQNAMRGENQNGLGVGGDVMFTLDQASQHAIAFGWQNSASQGDSVSEKCTPSLDKNKTPAVDYTTKLHNTASNNAGKIFEERTTCLDANSPPPALLTSMAVRRLTPRECERLQGFPDDYTLISVGNRMAADGPRYKAMGNSMAVPVMRWIGERIAEVHAQ